MINELYIIEDSVTKKIFGIEIEIEPKMISLDECSEYATFLCFTKELAIDQLNEIAQGFGDRYSWYRDIDPTNLHVVKFNRE